MKIKNYFYLVLTVFLNFISFINFAQSWEQVQDFPGTPRDDGSSFTIGNKTYCGLGMDAGFSCKSDFYCFDASTNSWATSTSLPTNQERQYAISCSWNNKGFVFGGIKCDGTFLNDLWIFDPISETWFSGIALPAEGRAGSAHFILGDTLYIVGGKNTTGITTDVWAFDFISNSWTQKTAYPGDGIWRGISFGRNYSGYAGLGRNNLNSQTELNTSIYSYNSLINNWTLMPDLGFSPRCYSGTAQKDSLVIVFGGLDASNSILNSFDRIDIDLWNRISLPNFNSTPRKGGMCFLSNELFHVTTGVSQTARLNETWRIGNVLKTIELGQNEWSFFPNPCNDLCSIEFSKPYTGILLIYSLDGRLTKHYDLLNSSNFEINTKEYFEGTYMLKIGSVTELLVIQK